jgi:hypothetical protein
MTTSRCDHTTHYGCLGPRWGCEPGGEQSWTGECGVLTTNPSGLCAEHEADWKENYHNHPLKARETMGKKEDTYRVEISRRSSVEVEVDDCASPDEAVAVVDRVDYQLPDPNEWHVNKDSYEYVVYDADGNEVLRND